MERFYSSGVETKTPKFFVGLEVETTAAYGFRTLFCRGDVPLEEILIQLFKDRNIGHVYLNSNHTYLKDGNHKAETLLDLGFWVTVEENIADELPLLTHPKFIVIVSVPIRSVDRQNLYIKVDDVGFNKTNQGVWTFQIGQLPNRFFTPWTAYSKDTIIDVT